MDINAHAWRCSCVNKTTGLTSPVTFVVTGRKKHQLNTLHVLLPPGSARTPLCPLPTSRSSSGQRGDSRSAPDEGTSKAVPGFTGGLGECWQGQTSGWTTLLQSTSIPQCSGPIKRDRRRLLEIEKPFTLPYVKASIKKHAEIRCLPLSFFLKKSCSHSQQGEKVVQSQPVQFLESQISVREAKRYDGESWNCQVMQTQLTFSFSSGTGQEKSKKEQEKHLLSLQMLTFSMQWKLFMS